MFPAGRNGDASHAHLLIAIRKEFTIMSTKMHIGAPRFTVFGPSEPFQLCWVACVEHEDTPRGDHKHHRAVHRNRTVLVAIIVKYARSPLEVGFWLASKVQLPNWTPFSKGVLLPQPMVPAGNKPQGESVSIFPFLIFLKKKVDGKKPVL